MFRMNTGLPISLTHISSGFKPNFSSHCCAMRSSPTPGRGTLLLLLAVVVVVPAAEVGACMPRDKESQKQAMRFK
jgi:hypothetical protein